MNEDCTSTLLENLCLLLMRHGVPAEEAKSELIVLLHDYEISRKHTEMVPYTGGRNEYYLKKFIVAKKVKGCTDRTLQLYYQSCGDALRAIGKDLTEITTDDILYYLAQKMRRGVSKVTCNGNRLNLSSFFGWLYREEIIKTNPMTRVDRIKCHSERESAFSQEEIERMRVHLNTWREKAVFETLLSTGCRASELTHIKILDVNGKEIVVFGKGEKYRTVYLNARAVIAIEQYLAERKDSNPYLFPAAVKNMIKHFAEAAGKYKQEDLQSWYKLPQLVRPGEPMDIGSLRLLLERAAKKADVENCHPHRFRRTCATLALRKGMPLELVSKMLGHANLDTTKIYLDISENDMRNAHEKYVT